SVTDGRYVYMRGIPGDNNAPLFDYTLMPTHMNRRFDCEDLAVDRVELAEPFSFTRGCPTLKIGLPADQQRRPVPDLERDSMRSALYDTRRDPGQAEPLNDPAVEQRMADLLVAEMKRCDAPPEQYIRLGLK
ncbi:MAG: sulfatase, partial [Planctomycetota bacterium]